MPPVGGAGTGRQYLGPVANSTRAVCAARSCGPQVVMSPLPQVEVSPARCRWSARRGPRTGIDESTRGAAFGGAARSWGQALSQKEAARKLGLSVRQVKRLCRQLRERGPAGLISKRRGAASNLRIAESVRERSLACPWPWYGGTTLTSAPVQRPPQHLHQARQRRRRTHAVRARAAAVADRTICAHSPQAKGRVERLFQTLQDRLVKALRLAGIDDIDKANAWCPSTWRSTTNALP